VQRGLAGENDDPLDPGLIVPEARRARLTGRDDPLDARPRFLGEGVDLFLRRLRGDVREEISALDHACLPRRAHFVAEAVASPWGSRLLRDAFGPRANSAKVDRLLR